LENGVEAGIQKVYELFKTHRIFVSRSCPILIDELQTYSRELDDNSKPTDKIDNKEQYHTLDALRYAMSDFRPVGVPTGNYAPIRTLSF
jgi:phage terminase large subunit